MIAALAPAANRMTPAEIEARRAELRAICASADDQSTAVAAAIEENRLRDELRRRYPPARPLEKRLAEAIVHLEAAIRALTPDEAEGGKAAELLVDIGYVLARTHDLFRETEHG